MLILFGFRIRFRTTGTVSFFCPRCGGDRRGDRRNARRWFTLFWIPVIPCNQVGKVVECTTCRTRFEPEVADQPTTADLSKNLGTAVRALTAMIVRTADHDDPALRTAAVRDVRVVEPTYDDRRLRADLAAVDPGQAARYVAPLNSGLQVPGKERFIADLVRVALTSGTISVGQRQVLDLAGRGLGLTPAYVSGVISSVVAAATPVRPSFRPPAGDTEPNA